MGEEQRARADQEDVLRITDKEALRAWVDSLPPHMKRQPSAAEIMTWRCWQAGRRYARFMRELLYASASVV